MVGQTLNFQVTVRTLLFLASMVIPSEAQTIDELLDRAEAANRAGLKDRALRLLDEAVRVESDNSEVYLFRGRLLSESEQPEAAISDYTRVLELDPKLRQTHNLRGLERFKMGHIEEAIRDFDKAIELHPSLEPYHWQRGIAFYYAGHYQEGRRQFELHRLVNPNDVENAVWHFLCVAKLEGVEAARQVMIPIQIDRRVPMMEIDELFRGEGAVEKVIQATRAGKPPAAELNQRLFYADLYLGLYHEALGNRTKALDHIRRAAHDYGAGHYMAEVARVHLRLSQESEIR